ncbi:MAG: hypothetical protein KA715_11665 [Xanthomonadaceae bacterium]|nr:hypothetical protein [Xanthomonadaceae bacterium]
MGLTTMIQAQNFHWLDLVDPTVAELEEVAKKYGLHPTSVQDCLDPEHLPKFERIDTLTFIILRAFDHSCDPHADTVQELTRKVAIFYTPAFLITVHRSDQVFFEALREKWKTKIQSLPYPAPHLVSDLIYSIFHSYEKPIDNDLDLLEKMEMKVFGTQGAKSFEVEEAYYLKRRASVFKRMLKLSADLLPKISSLFEGNNPLFQDIRDSMDSLFFFVDELMENTNSLLYLHLSLASHRLNDVIRVLTIISVFILPLNLITGIYGMNFEWMPELKMAWGYPIALFSMAGIVAGLFFWFRKKGWLKS